jgi:hypothetical protein
MDGQVVKRINDSRFAERARGRVDHGWLDGVTGMLKRKNMYMKEAKLRVRDGNE